MTVKAPKGKIDMKELVRKLGRMKITSVLIEGGGEVGASAIEAGIVDKAYFFIVPKIFGGKEAKTPVEGLGVKVPSQAKHLKNIHEERVGGDFLITGYL